MEHHGLTDRRPITSRRSKLPVFKNEGLFESYPWGCQRDEDCIICLEKVNSQGNCYKTEVSGREGPMGRMPLIIWCKHGLPLLSTPFHLLKIWKQIVMCSQRMHSSGGTHYRVAVKLSNRRRWLRVRNYLDENHGIQVNLSSVYSNYCRAWRYTRKEDHPINWWTAPHLEHKRPVWKQRNTMEGRGKPKKQEKR